MQIQNIANNIYRKTASEALAGKAADTYKAAYQACAKTDRVEISSKANEEHASDEKLTATSGKDTLGITKGSKDGSFVIHFADSAIVSRAVSRGYITVNGTKIELTDDVKQQLIKADKQAQVERERAFSEYVMHHELAVAQQQSEVYGKATDDMSEALEIASKISNGDKVTPLEEQKLLEYNPQLYSMSKTIASMVKQEQKQDAKAVQSPKSDKKASKANNAVTGEDVAPIEFKTYETTLTVSLPDSIQIQMQ